MSGSNGMPGTTGMGNLARSIGKPARQQTLPTGGRASITSGDPLHRAMGHYGKNPPVAHVPTSISSGPGTTVGDPTSHPGAKQIRGGVGGMKRNPRQGGLGQGPDMTAGGSNDYSMNTQDAE